MRVANDVRRVSSVAASSSSRMLLLLLWWVCLFSSISPARSIDAMQKSTTTSTGGATTATTTSTTSGGADTQQIKTFRKKNLDYLDAETLTYYLTLPTTIAQQQKQAAKDSNSVADEDDLFHLPDYDVAVLFYAKWDTNSVRLAGTWDKIATMLHAGTSPDSKLIVALFDCEADYAHASACTQAGITHYPTMFYLSMAEGQVLQHKFPKHAAKFKGNWQYGDAILDWIQTMRGLAQWHRAGWGKRLRSLLTSSGKPKKKKELPIGRPGTTTSSATATGISGSSFSSSSTTGDNTVKQQATSSANANDEVNLKLQQALSEKDKMRDLAVRSSVMIESLLFPRTMPLTTPGHPTAEELAMEMSDNGSDGGSGSRSYNKNYTDVFKLLNATDGWTSTTDAATILRTCSQDIALDYCDRFKLIATEEFLVKEEQKMVEHIAGSRNNKTADANIDWKQLQSSLQTELEAQEPYCLLLEDCILSQFKEQKCRPSTCPFQDAIACRYLTSCFYESLQQDYAKALGITYNPKTGASSSTSTATGTGPGAGAGTNAAGTTTKPDAAEKKDGGGGGFWGSAKKG